jgi:hypothetical protein
MAHPNPARWPGYRHLVPVLPAARGHARRRRRLSSVASRSHPTAARSILAAPPLTVPEIQPGRPGAHRPGRPACLQPVLYRAGRSRPGRFSRTSRVLRRAARMAQLPGPAAGCDRLPDPFRLFTSAFADQHLAAVRLSLDNDLGKHALCRCDLPGSAGRPIVAGRRVRGSIRAERIVQFRSGVRVESGLQAGQAGQALPLQRLADHLVGQSGRVALAGGPASPRGGAPWKAWGSWPGLRVRSTRLGSAAGPRRPYRPR